MAHRPMTPYSYEDTDLASSTRYYYIVRAVNSDGNGPWSANVSGVTTPGNPDAPVLTATALSETSIQLDWNTPNDNGTPIAGYQLQRWNPADNGVWAAVADFPTTSTVTEYIDTLPVIVAGTTHYYRVRAMPQTVDLDGSTNTDNEGWSADDMEDAASATTHGNVPARPTLTVGTLTTNTVPLMWENPGAGGAPISSYELRIWDSATSQWVLEANIAPIAAKENPTDSTMYEYPDMNLAAGTTFYYVLRAKNSQGDGPWSTYVTAKTLDGPAPDAPVLTATTVDTSSIRLTWTIPNENGQDITGFMLERFNPGMSPPWEAVTITVGNDVTLHTDSNLVAGKTYYYRIRTVPESDYSTVVNAKTVEAAPGRPQSVTAAADGETAIDISWDAPMYNGGNAIVHYRIEMWNSSSKSWTHVITLAAAHTTYKHRGPDCGHTLCLPRARREPGTH